MMSGSNRSDLDSCLNYLHISGPDLFDPDIIIFLLASESGIHSRGHKLLLENEEYNHNRYNA